MKGKLFAVSRIFVLSVITALVATNLPVEAATWSDVNNIETQVRSVPQSELAEASYSGLPGCKHTIIQIQGKTGPQAACVAYAKNYSLAWVRLNNTFLIRIGSDTIYRNIRDAPTSLGPFYVVSESDTLVQRRLARALDISLIL